jgi:hypothetical protein
MRSTLTGVVLAAVLPFVPAHVVNEIGPAEAVGDPVIAAAGDIACDPADSDFNGGSGRDGDCEQAATAALLAQINPAAVLPLGDNQYYCGGYSAFLQSYNLSWGQFLARTYPAVGNHEYLTSGGTGCNGSNEGAAGYFSYYSNAAMVGAPDQLFYSYDIGSWHLIALNSNCSSAGGCGPSSAQGQWLAADLAANPAACTLAYWHIPVWSSGGRDSSNMASITQQLYDAGVDVVLTGHDHIYERFAPQDAQSQPDPVNGIRAFVVGTGGANHTTLVTAKPNSEVRNASAYGVLKLTLHSTSYDWAFVPVPGQTFTDSGAQACHGPDDPPPARRTTNTLGPWIPAGGSLKNSPAIGAPGLVGTASVFARGGDDAVWTGTYADEWQGWTSLGGITIAGPAASSRSATTTDVFATGADNAEWWRSKNNGTWSPWTSLGGSTADGPAAASWSSTRIDLFRRGLDDQLWHRAYSNGSWGAWTSLGGVLTSAPAVASLASGVLDVAARGADGAAWVRSFRANSWGPWTKVGGILVGQPSLATRAGNELDLFAVGTDGQLWNIIRDDQGWAGPFRPLGGLHAAGPGTALSTTGGVIAIAGLGVDYQLWFNRAT